MIPVPNDDAGELPKAYAVKAQGLKDSDEVLKREIKEHVEKNKARHKWLKEGVEFVDLIPKTASGKILRQFLRDENREARGARL
jgi:acyl-coenzyme A synthetase/AMP-(fatty) acid ligase